MRHIEEVEVSYAEGKNLLDRAAQRYLGISGDEFLRRYDAGEYRGTEDAIHVEMLIPFARPVPAQRVIT